MCRFRLGPGLHRPAERKPFSLDRSTDGVVDTEPITLTVDDAAYPGELTLPDEGSDTAAVLLPGANHGPYGDVFDRLAEELAAAGVALLRFESWGDDEALPALDGKDREHVLAEFDAAVAYLTDQGYDRVGAVAKSFGGRLALGHCPEAVEELVLWAPAAFLEGGEAVESVELPDEAPDDAELPTMAASSLADHDHPVTILQGDEDFYTAEGARELAAELPDATVAVLEGGDHSFVGGDPEREAVERTVECLSAAP